MPQLEKRQAGAEVTAIEATPEMIEAGVDEFLSLDSEDLAYSRPQDIVRWIFSAMAKAARRGRVSTG